jgi:hypothetical protein
MAIQQKLHTKLVQKLILTPSLQQAIKLLPMSTLELADLLNQEVVENPMLEEVPTEDLQPTEAAAQAEKTEAAAKEKGDAWDDSDYEYFFGDYLDDGYRPHTPQEVKELPPIENTLATSSRSPITCCGNSRSCPTTTRIARSARRSSATSTTTACSSRRSRRLPPWARGRSRRSSAR